MQFLCKYVCTCNYKDNENYCVLYLCKLKQKAAGIDQLKVTQTEMCHKRPLVTIYVSGIQSVKRYLQNIGDTSILILFLDSTVPIYLSLL